VAPPLVLYQGIHRGNMPQANSFLSVDAPDVDVSSIKLAEEGGSVIVRMYETDGVETAAKLDMHFANVRWQGRLHPFEIKTLRVDPNSKKVEEVNLLEQ
jgi:alpha-mannosidase